MQTRRLHESFEGSYSSLAYPSEELSRFIASYFSRQRETHAFSDFVGKMGFWGHNFGSRHARRSSKVFIDAGDHLVATKNFSEIFGPLDWRPGSVKFGQKNKNTPILPDSPRQTPNPNQQMFLLIEPRRLPASVEGLNNALAIAAGTL